VIIFDSVYETFRELLIAKTEKLRLGTSDEDDFGPVINEGQLQNMVSAVERARQSGANILTGGKRLTDAAHREGFYMAATLIDGVAPRAEISECELFGPVAILYRVRDFDEALALANNSPYGLTASIHTKSIHRAMRFCDKVQTGVAVVNAGTHGSEPHMPFGGRKQSGNGSREPGTEALNIYSELKDLYINIDLTGL
jgi:aldehyde dehydrogenase (NAD+)